MGWSLSEILFYGGIIAACVSCAAAMICFFVLKIEYVRLNAKLDEEYGKEEKRSRHD